MNVKLCVSATYLQKRKQEFRTEFSLVLYTIPVLQIWILVVKIYIPSVHTYIRTYIPWNHKCVLKAVGSGKSHKYTNIQIYYRTFFTKVLILFTMKVT
jgi:hypothetical protein